MNYILKIRGWALTLPYHKEIPSGFKSIGTSKLFKRDNCTPEIYAVYGFNHISSFLKYWKKKTLAKYSNPLSLNPVQPKTLLDISANHEHIQKSDTSFSRDIECLMFLKYISSLKASKCTIILCECCCSVKSLSSSLVASSLSLISIDLRMDTQWLIWRQYIIYLPIIITPFLI